MSTFQPSPGDRPTNVHPDMYSSEYGYRGLSEAEALRESQSRNVHLRQELGKAQLEIQQLTQELGMLKAKWIAHTCSTSAKTSTPEQPASGQPNDLQRLKMALIYANLWFNQSKYGGITERIVDESLARDVDVSAAGRPSLTVDRRAILLVTKSLFETYAGSDELTAQLVGGLISSAKQAITNARSHFAGKVRESIANIFPGKVPSNPLPADDLYPPGLGIECYYRSLPVARVLALILWGSSFFREADPNGAVNGKTWQIEKYSVNLTMISNGFTLARWCTAKHRSQLKPRGSEGQNWEENTMATLTDMVVDSLDPEKAAAMEETLDWYTVLVLPDSKKTKDIRIKRPYLASLRLVDTARSQTPDLNEAMNDLSLSAHDQPQAEFHNRAGRPAGHVAVPRNEPVPSPTLNIRNEPVRTGSRFARDPRANEYGDYNMPEQTVHPGHGDQNFTDVGADNDADYEIDNDADYEIDNNADYEIDNDYAPGPTTANDPFFPNEPYPYPAPVDNLFGFETHTNRNDLTAYGAETVDDREYVQFDAGLDQTFNNNAPSAYDHYGRPQVTHNEDPNEQEEETLLPSNHDHQHDSDGNDNFDADGDDDSSNHSLPRPATPPPPPPAKPSKGSRGARLAMDLVDSPARNTRHAAKRAQMGPEVPPPAPPIRTKRAPKGSQVALDVDQGSNPLPVQDPQSKSKAKKRGPSPPPPPPPAPRMPPPPPHPPAPKSNDNVPRQRAALDQQNPPAQDQPVPRGQHTSFAASSVEQRQAQHRALGMGRPAGLGQERRASLDVSWGQQPPPNPAMRSASATYTPRPGPAGEQWQGQTGHPPSHSTTSNMAGQRQQQPMQRISSAQRQPPVNARAMRQPVVGHAPGPAPSSSTNNQARPRPTQWTHKTSDPSARMSRVPEYTNDEDTDISVQTHSRQIADALAHGRRRGMAYDGEEGWN